MQAPTEIKGKEKGDEPLDAYPSHGGILFNNYELFEAYNELQRVARDFDTTFEAPEILVVGTQSAGKSSMLEALVGFRFNYIGTGQTVTRRPLVVQMMRDEAFEVPHCVFLPEKDDFNSMELEVAVREVPAEIRKRTLQYCGNEREFYEVPIILRVQFKYCANLTVIDMPGFVIQGNERSVEKIRSMACNEMKPQNRIIVCLEESGRDWSLSIARPIVESIDPKLERTIIVGTKFDARLKELKADPNVVNDFIRGSGYLPKLPFLFQLPIERSLDGREFCEAIEALAAKDIEDLLQIGMDKRFVKQIGFPNLRNYLEELLLEKYKESLPTTFHILNQKCKEIESEKDKVSQMIEAMQVSKLRVRVSHYINDLHRELRNYFKGTVKGNPAANGQTSREERDACGFNGWPGLILDMQIVDSCVENVSERLYGGAQYYRLQREFEAVVRSIEFPPTTISEVANALGQDEVKSNPDYDWAACEIARQKIKGLYNPFLTIFCKRLEYVMKRLFPIVTKHLDDKEFPDQYSLFFEELQKIYEEFIEEYSKKLYDDLNSILEQLSGYTDPEGHIAFNDMAEEEQELLQPSPEETKQRVIREMNRKVRHDPFKELKMRDVRVVDAAVAKAVMEEAARHFISIRCRFADQFKRSANVQFWSKMYSDLGKRLSAEVAEKGDEDYVQLCNVNSASLLERREYLERKLRNYRASRQQFANIASKIKTIQTFASTSASAGAAAASSSSSSLSLSPLPQSLGAFLTSSTSSSTSSSSSSSLASGSHSNTTAGASSAAQQPAKTQPSAKTAPTTASASAGGGGQPGKGGVATTGAAPKAVSGVKGN
jgi:GTPase SAR1 family protein